jgi:hypothetical protein
MKGVPQGMPFIAFEMAVRVCGGHERSTFRSRLRIAAGNHRT